jgi:hypothetical protein
LSLERCLEIIEQKLDREQDYPGLFEDLADLENQTLEEDEAQDYHTPLGAFLERMEELFAEEVFEKEIAAHVVSNLRADLEKIRDSRPPSDPLEHLFRDMLRYENGLVTSSIVLTTLSHYEELVLALRFQFEGSTDPTDEREVPQMMRAGLSILEETGKYLRQQLNNESDAHFDQIRERFTEGANILREFRRRATFVEPEPEYDEDEAWE